VFVRLLHPSTLKNDSKQNGALSELKSPLLIVTMVIGVMFIALAVMMSRADLWPSVLLEIGVAVGLSGCILVFERHLDLKLPQPTAAEVAEFLAQLINDESGRTPCWATNRGPGGPSEENGGCKCASSLRR
jgi:hypothetical protein